MLGRFRDAAETDPRTPQLRPRRPGSETASASALDRDPVLVLPTLDDVFRFERELCADGRALGGSVMTFGGLFREVAAAAGAPPARGADPRPAAGRRLGGDRRAPRELGPAAPLRRPARLRDRRSSACSTSCRAPASSRPSLEAGRGRRSSAPPTSATSPALFAGYAEVARPPRPASTSHGVARAAIERCCAAPARPGGERPVFLYEPGRPHPEPARAARGAERDQPR